MLHTVFVQVLDMSMTASVVIAVVLLARLLLKRTPKVFSYALWAVVLFRLLCPFSMEAPVSVMPERPPVSQNYALPEETPPILRAEGSAPQIIGGVPDIEEGTQSEPIAQQSEIDAAYPADRGTQWISIASGVWTAGVLVMLLHSAVSYAMLRRKLRVVIPLRGNIFVADDIKSPCVVGWLRPKIYLPCVLTEKEQEYIILHEQYHIRHMDHWVKLIAFLALTIHWFNPLVWVAFVLAGRDMEMRCDEAVIRRLGSDIRADYSASLLTLATRRRIIAGTPLAFGEGNTKGRIRNLAKWKKPALWVIVTAVIACGVLAVCLLTDPKTEPAQEPPVQEEPGTDLNETTEIAGKTYLYENEGFMGHFTITLNEDGTFSYYEGPLSSYLGSGTWVLEGNLLTLTDTGGYPLVNRFLIDGEDLVFVAEGSTNFLYVKVQDGERFSREAAIGQKNAIIAIVDPTKDGEFAYDDAVEKFFEDENNEYFFSGIYSQYVIVHYADGTTEDIIAALSSGRATLADLDKYGVRYFAEPKEIDLSDAIIAAILGNNRSSEPDGLTHCASFVLLGQQEFRPYNVPVQPLRVTVYGIALHQAFSVVDGALYEVWGSHMPVAITFEADGSGYRVLEYWHPRDGIYYEEDIREKFPDDIEDEAMDLPKYILAQKQTCYEQAVAHRGLDVDAVIDSLLTVIESSPLHSSNPGDYIDAHSIEYRELLWYGEYTLNYIFARFLEGDQIGLRGHILRELLDDLAPEAQLRLYAMTGQQYFNAWLTEAVRLSEEHDMDWIKENQPAAWLLLQMIGG